MFAPLMIPRASALNLTIVDVEAEVNLTPSATFTTTSASHASIAGWQMHYFKRDAATRLLVLPIFTMFATGAACSTECAIQVNGAGTDHVAGYFNFNLLSDHKQVVGAVIIPGLDGGAKTLQLRSRRFGGTGTVTADGNDRCSLYVFEIA